MKTKQKHVYLIDGFCFCALHYPKQPGFNKLILTPLYPVFDMNRKIPFYFLILCLLAGITDAVGQSKLLKSMQISKIPERGIVVLAGDVFAERPFERIAILGAQPRFGLAC